MPRPPYKDEGILGPGGRKFVAALLTVAVLVGVGLAALEVDFGELADEIEEASEPADERSTAPGEPGGGEGGDSAAPPALSTGGLAHALAALREEIGGDPNLLRVMAMPGGIELDVRGGEEPTGFGWSAGELTELPVAVAVGAGRLEERDFQGSQVEPGSLGRLLSGARRHVGGRNLEVVNAILEQGLIEPKLRWVLNAEAPNGANLSFQARPSGRGVDQVGSSGPPGAGLPPPAQRQIRDAERRTACIQDAAGDVAAITRCVERSPP